MSIIVFLFIGCEVQRPTSDVQYTPHTRAFTLITIPLLVKESATTFDFLHKDFAKGGVLHGKEVYTFSPDHLTVYQGDTVNLTIVNPEDDGHTFTLKDFNVNLALSPQATTRGNFVANKVGTFTFYCDMAPHMPFMSGQLIVLPDSSGASS
ncbi:cupredoxin domain-containing protein [Dictyobacter aurantiacus]|nr:cupredoxin domain-containing protein [Dictyobacter aurantiacus]